MSVHGWRAVGAILLIAVLAGCSDPPPMTSQSSAQTLEPTVAAAPPPADARQVVVVGDEYATGTPGGGQGPTNWTGILQRRVGAAGADAYVRNFGRPGRGYNPTTAGTATFADVLSRGVNADTDLVMFIGGANDVGSLDTLRNAVSDTIAEARALAPGARMVVVGPMWSKEGPPDDAVLAASNIIRDAAAGAGVEFIDPIAENWFGGRPELIDEDGVYPSDAGQAVIAERLTDRTLAALNAAPPGPP